MLAVFLVVILPLCLDVFRLNLVAKYLTYAFVALGLVICWGYGGILSLGQGVFFGLGGYCMAMFLKLEASSPENTKIQSTPGIPDFMDWNQITSLPLFWKPFHSLTFTIAAVILVPGIFALIIGAAMFKRRVGGTYFAIITQAVAAILTILIVGQQGYTGGINGMTDLRTLKGWDIRPDHAKIVLYFFEVGCLFVCIFIAQFIRHSKLGRILVAMRDKEDRVRFSGYSVANFKIFAFCIAAVFAAIGGAMFALNVGFMSPSFVGIVPSIEMVIYTAVGGRLSILGAVYGTLLVNFAKTSLSESFPELWLFGLGGLFIAVVLAFPNGLAGIWGDYVQPRIDRLISSRKSAVRTAAGPTIPSPTARRPSEEIVMLIGHQPKDFLLSVEALTVSFDGFKAVNDLSFYVDENEIRVIIGPNGAGKTTVLDLICGKTKATSGSIHFRDKDLTKMKENQIVQAGVGRKFQTPSIYDDLTVFENLEISFPRGRTVFGALTFTRDAVVRDRVHEVAEMIFLKDRLERERRTAQPRPEAVARDRHAADPGSRVADARRAGGRHERQRTRQDRRAAQPHHQGPLGAGDRARHEIRRGHRPQGHGAASGPDPVGGHDGARQERSQGHRSLSRAT